MPKCKKCPEFSTTAGAGANERSDCKCKTVKGVQYSGADGGKCAPPTRAPTKKPAPPPTKPPDNCPAKYFLAGSAASCDDLGLAMFDYDEVEVDQVPLLTNAVNKRPCGTVFKQGSTQCINNAQKMTYDAAKQYCEDRDMRLCTAMELREAIPLGPEFNTFVAREKQYGTKCWGTQFQQKKFWSMKPCAEKTKWNGDRSNAAMNNREISYHVVAVPYLKNPAKGVEYLDLTLGDDPDKDVSRNKRNAMKDSKGGFWPSTTDNGDVCETRKPSANKKHHVACCADENAKYCHKCPRNSCADQTAGVTGAMLAAAGVGDRDAYCALKTKKNSFECRSDDLGKDQGVNGVDWHACKSGATSNTDCRCNEGFDYNIDQYTVCRHEKVTSAPTEAPTKAPTAAPPKFNFCPANMFWNGNRPQWQSSDGIYDFEAAGQGGHTGCDFGLANTLYNKGTGFPDKKVLSKISNSKRKTFTGSTRGIDQGPNKAWQSGCRGWGKAEDRTEDGVSANDDYKNEWTRRATGTTASDGELMCSATAKYGGENYWRNFLVPVTTRMLPPIRALPNSAHHILFPTATRLSASAAPSRCLGTKPPSSTALLLVFASAA